MISQSPGAARVQQSAVLIRKAAERSGIARARQESGLGWKPIIWGHLSWDSADNRLSHASANSRQIQHKSKDFSQRDGQHGTSAGARILQVQKEARGTWHLVRTWAGGSDKERQLKTRAGKAYCPDCNEHPLPGDTPPRKGAKYLTRKMRRERQAARQARENDPWKDLAMQEMTHAQLREKLGRFPGPAAPELPYEEQLRRIEELEATWRRAAPPQMELEAG